VYISIYALFGRISHKESSVQGRESFKIQNLFLHGVVYGCETWHLTLSEEHVVRIREGTEEDIWAKEERGNRE